MVRERILSFNAANKDVAIWSLGSALVVALALAIHYPPYVADDATISCRYSQEIVTGRRPLAPLW